ncbi:hypothetical protein RM533_11405 [Croceicoccus sp. F390]|uniref:DUF4352 domain-containing protein n=1 Tax=Croceicoccus esteveae TaxID=3075597 RepID=A0ABU2ZK77_9SPHN|nr:hypothetical protein [Croceicoccus sp. F390]MDT0576780.1 hypothetical protein [Croceicoccus sp. F390]
MLGSNRGAGSPHLAEQQNGECQAQAENQSTENNQTNASRSEKQTVLIANRTAIETISSDAQAQRAEQRAETDLQAQQDMAFYALLMFIASLVTIAVTAIGIWYVKRTLDATLAAVKGAEIATDAMKEANRIADQAQRPWLTVDLNFDFTDEHGSLLFCNITITNIGRSPAYNVSVFNETFGDVMFGRAEDFKEISANMMGNYDEPYSRIILPDSSERMQINPKAIYHTVMAGTFTHPEVLVIVNYQLSNGQHAQTSAWFEFGYGEQRNPIPRGVIMNRDNIKTGRIGYVRVA